MVSANKRRSARAKADREFAARMIALREAAGLSQRALADLLGLSQGHVSALESFGTTSRSLRVLFGRVEAELLGQPKS